MRCDRILDIGYAHFLLVIKRGGLAVNSELDEGTTNSLNQCFKIERTIVMITTG